MGAQISQSLLSEKELVTRAIQRIEAKLAACLDEPSRFYYRAVLVGWREHLRRLG